MFSIKICGIQTPADATACIAAGADALGFIFAPSPAQLDLVTACRLAGSLPHGVARVGVFCNNDRHVIHAAIEALCLDFLQFCGGEQPQFCGSFGVPTIGVVGVKPTRGKDHLVPDVRSLRIARAQAVLIDSRTAGKAGGTGITVDAGLARALAARFELPVILAGGLTPANVRDMIDAVRPSAVDVRTGVERDGRKDPLLVGQFVSAARAALEAAV